MTAPATAEDTRVPSVLLGGPLCGQEFAIAAAAPAVTLWEVDGGVWWAYERTASTEVSTGRWVWRFLCKCGRKGGPKQ